MSSSKKPPKIPGEAPPVRLGISACLLGGKVRYDGGHKLVHYLKKTLGNYVDWVPVCPEMEAGLGVPREPMRLEGTINEPRLVTRQTSIDHTGRMLRWAHGRVRELSREQLCGFIFKSRSPSCGMRVKVYSKESVSGRAGSGIWAAAFMAANPSLPVEDEGSLRDSGIREAFIERVFVYHRWLQLVAARSSIERLAEFHSDHKYLIMAHSPAHLRDLSRIVSDTGNTKGGKPAAREIYAAYLPRLMTGMKLQATVKKNVNVLNQMMGYLKRTLAPDEKQELTEVIEDYHRGLTPLVVPVTLMRHYVRKYGVPYLSRQLYLNPLWPDTGTHLLLRYMP